MAMEVAGRPSTPGDDDAHRLRALLLRHVSAPSSSISPSEIASACNAVQSVALQQPRAFFRLCFPLLLRCLFGFQDSSSGAPSSTPLAQSGGWLSLLVSHSGNDSAIRAIHGLLAPDGALFHLLLVAEREGFVRYVFPLERLPDWVRRFLLLENGASILSQVSFLFKNKIKTDTMGAVQVELDEFQYYVFSFAYYVVCKDVGGFQSGPRKARMTPSRSLQLRTQIGNWASSIPGLNSLPQLPGYSGPMHPYLQLLQLYLDHLVGYVPKDRAAITPVDNLSTSHADIFIHTLIEFWLIDDDPFPLPFMLRQALQYHLPAPLSVLYIPPGADLTDSVNVVISYFHLALRTCMGNQLANYTMPTFSDPGLAHRRRSSPHAESRLLHGGIDLSSMPIAPYLHSLRRPFYRFLLRAFKFWPSGSPVRKVSNFVELWINYLEPWEPLKYQPQVSKENGAISLSSRKEPVLGLGYGAMWEPYVCSNYLFYTSLIVHFLEFALKHLPLDVEGILQLILKILTVVSKSKELLDLLRKVDAAYFDYLLARPRALNNSLAELAPMIHEQLQDWEEGGEQEHAEMVYMPTQRTYTLRFFGSGDGGAHHMLQALILQAETNVHASKEKVASSIQMLDQVKAVIQSIFEISKYGEPLIMPYGALPDSISQVEPTFVLHRPNGAADASYGFHRSGEISPYKGDWMRRPIGTSEIGWLVRLLVRASEKLNLLMGLVPKEAIHQEARQEASIHDEHFAAARIPMATSESSLLGLISWIKCLAIQFWGVLRPHLIQRGFRINLRFLAEKHVLALLCLSICIYWIVRC